MKEQDKKKLKEKLCSKKYFLKFVMLFIFYLFLIMFFNPQFYLSKIIDWKAMLGSLYMQLYGAIIGILITDFLPIKKEIIKTLIVVIFAMIADVFITLEFVFEGTVKNIVMASIAGFSFLVFIVFSFANERINAKIDRILDDEKWDRVRGIYKWVVISVILLFITGIVFSMIVFYSNRPFLSVNLHWK